MSAAPKVDVTFENNFRDARIQIENIMSLGIGKVAKEVAVQIAGNITTGKLVDTGNYRRSWDFREVSPTEWVIGSPVEYGVYLEFGHRTKAGTVFPLMQGGRPVLENGRQAFRTIKTAGWVPGRPHIIPAARTVADRIRQLFKESM